MSDDKDKMKSPTLSIIMPVFNAEPYIKEAVESLLHQTFNDFELIIVNDGSTDRSMQILGDLKDPRINLISNSTNRGIVYSRNRGLENACGRFLAPFDADDFARKDKFEKQVGFLEQNPTYGMIGSWARLMDENGRLLKERWKVNAPPERIPSILLFRNYFIQSSVVIRREALPKGNYAADYDVVEDYKMWIDIARNTKVWNYPDYLVFYRVHHQSATQLGQNLMSKKDAMIFTHVYQPLGINLNTNQLRLLSEIKNSTSLEDLDDLQKIESFLLQVLEQNQKQGIYDEKELVKVVFNRWLKSCFRYKTNRIKALKKGVFSPLLQQYCRQFRF